MGRRSNYKNSVKEKEIIKDLIRQGRADVSKFDDDALHFIAPDNMSSVRWSMGLPVRPSMIIKYDRRGNPSSRISNGKHFPIMNWDDDVVRMLKMAYKVVIQS